VSTSPRVSVVVPLYNLREFVADAIESALAQTLPAEDVEVVVVDDGSTDGGDRIARQYVPRVRYVRQENRGLSAARNAGIRISRAPFLAFLDADDRFLPEKLEAQLAVLAARPDVGLVYSGFRYIDGAGAPLPQYGWFRGEGDVFPDLILGNRIHPVVALVRREAVERTGGFDETLGSVEDWDLWLRLSRTGLRWALVDRPLAEYRVRADAMHANATRMAENWLRVLDKVFADPDLPAAVRELRPLAYHRAYLIAAADHYRSGDAAAAARWFEMAVRERPAFLTDVDALRLFCRWLLPLGYQRTAIMATEWRRLATTLRSAMAGVFAAENLEAEIARRRWPATVAAWRAVLPLLATRAKTMLGRRPPSRIALPAHHPA